MDNPSKVIAMFNINWTKKTKIVVDGKVYERLEDLPEHLRPLLKDSDGDGIPDIAAQGKKTWKMAPFIKVNFPPGEHLDMDPNVPVALPAGFRLDDNGSERRISWRWISMRAVGVFLFAVLWDSVLAAVLYAAFLGKAPPLSVLAVLLILGAIGAGMTYLVFAYLVNHTSVHVDAARVSVRHGPLPWFGAKDVSRTDIDRVLSERHAQLDDDGGIEPSVTYKVMLLLKGGVALSLVAGLHAPEQALFIEQQIRKS